MQHLKQLITTLVALFAISTGAWAVSDISLKEITADMVKETWKDNNTLPVTTTDFPGFTATTLEAAKALGVPYNTGYVYVIYGVDDNGYFKAFRYNNGEYDGEIGMMAFGSIYTNIGFGDKYYYTGSAGTALTKDKNDATGRTWILDKMLAGNVELQVEYEPEFTATFVAKNGNTIESGKATVSVKEGEAAAVAAKLEGNALKGLYEGQTVTLTAKQGYKFRSVEAKKAAAAGPTTAQLNVPDEWASQHTSLTASDMEGFVALTDEEAAAIACPDASGDVRVIHSILSDGLIRIIYFVNGVKQGDYSISGYHNDLYTDDYSGVKYYYTTGK